MKNKKQASEEQFELFEERARRKERTGKKSKFRRVISAKEEDGEAGRKRKLKAKPEEESFEEDWDEDDQILYQWRRKGEVSDLEFIEKEPPEE